jgi:hypothetical protein
MNLPHIPLRPFVASLLTALALSGCVVYEPVPSMTPVQTTRPASFDRSWSAAQQAAQDVEIQITTADRNIGLILGRKNSAEVAINLMPQADGSIRIKFDVKNLSPQDQGLAERYSHAYERRMGR